MDMDISMDIHEKSVDMDMDMDAIFHIHGNPGESWQVIENTFFSLDQTVYCSYLLKNLYFITVCPYRFLKTLSLPQLY